MARTLSSAMAVAVLALALLMVAAATSIQSDGASRQLQAQSLVHTRHTAGATVGVHAPEEEAKEEAAEEEPAKEEPSKEEPAKAEAAKEEPAKAKPAKKKESKVQQFLKAPVPNMPEVVHQKGRGNGYEKGSPLYGKQKLHGVPGQDAPDLPAPAPEVPESDLPEVDHKKMPPPPEFEEVFDVRMTPVSTTMRCIVNLCVQYFVVFAIATLARAVQMFSNKSEEEIDDSTLVRTLDACTSTVNFAPMLCVLFLATRLRAIQLTQGETERYSLPQIWTQAGMYVCTWTVFGQLLMVVAFAILSQRAPSTDADGNMTGTVPGGQCCGYFVQFLRLVLMAGLYGGFTVVCFGLWSMEAPKEVYPDGSPPISVMIHCVSTLAITYFFVYLCIAIVRTYNQLSKISRSKASDVLQLAAYTLNFAPMLCIMFAVARMRALQIDPVDGNPQRWAQACFWACTLSLVFQTFLVLLIPALCGGQAAPGSAQGDVRFKFGSSFTTTCFTVIRCILFAMLYIGFVGVLVSLCLIEHTDGRQNTPPFAPATQCVVALTLIFFLVYLLLWVATIYRNSQNRGDIEQDEVPGTLAVVSLERARGTVMLCPMLSVLFLGLRMRAMQITNNRGAPQGWAQDCMYVCVIAILLQLLFVLMVPLFTGKQVLETGRTAPQKHVMTNIVEVLRLVFLACMYGAAIGVIIAIFAMTAETANGRGASIPVSSNVDRSAVDTTLAL